MLTTLNKLIEHPAVPLAIRLMSLAAFAALVGIGLSAGSDDPALLMELRNTNLANLIVWSYWWPLIVVGAVFIGRAWCFACPVELITTTAARIGLKRKRPRWLTSGWAITVFYIIILFAGIEVLKIHRNPAMMAVYLVSIAGVSVITGLVFEKNTFCRYACPVGHLLGLYARLSFLGWRVGNPALCATCRDKSCVRRDYAYSLIDKSCGVDLYPGRLQDNSHCILCTGCRKTCGKYQSSKTEGRPNPGLRVIGFARDLLAHRPLSYAEAAFLFIVSGFVISEILTEWSVSAAALGWLPARVVSLTGASPVAAGVLKATIVFAGYPLVIWAAPYLAIKASRSDLRIGEYVRNYAPAFIPVMAAAHISKALLKMTSRLPMLPLAAHDPAGIETAWKILGNSIVVPRLPVWADGTVTALILLILAAGIYLSVKTINSFHAAAGPRRGMTMGHLIPAAYGGVFIVTIVLWRLL